MEEVTAGSFDGDASSSRDSDDEMSSMRKELIEFGLNEEDLSREEMSDLLKALRSSRSSATEEELQRSMENTNSSKSVKAMREVVVEMAESSSGGVSRKVLQRRYRVAADRRLPWCLLPVDLTPAQRVQCLAAYIKLLAVNQYRRARTLPNFQDWAPGVAITAGAHIGPARSTRSGRCVPSYTNLVDDDDESDIFVPKKTRKRKISNSENSTGNDGGIYCNKTFSLKRKTQKPECEKPEKDLKLGDMREVTIWNMEFVNKSSQDKGDGEKTTESLSTIIDSISNRSIVDNGNLAKIRLVMEYCSQLWDGSPQYLLSAFTRLIGNPTLTDRLQSLTHRRMENSRTSKTRQKKT